MSAEATLPLRPGDRVAGKFEVDRVLGMGGMGVVFGATDLTSGVRVAIKCLLPLYCENADVVTRFLREGRATMRLQSDHVAHVYETGALDPSGVPFIVMEYLDGRDLRSVVKNSGPIDVKDAAGYICQACVALSEAHALGIIHRDLKPANMFLTRRADGAALVKVLDFGIAKFTSPSMMGDHAEMTKTRAVLGSRAYMSPEQMLRPKDVDARADVWSLGVILYFLVTGKNPFASETTEALILRIVQGQAEPLSQALPGVPEAFERIVMTCLAKAREHRFANVTELRRALAPLARSQPDRATIELHTAAPRADDDSGPISLPPSALATDCSQVTARAPADDVPPSSSPQRKASYPGSIRVPEPSGPTMRGLTTVVTESGTWNRTSSTTAATIHRITRRGQWAFAAGSLAVVAVVVASIATTSRPQAAPASQGEVLTAAPGAPANAPTEALPPMVTPAEPAPSAAAKAPEVPPAIAPTTAPLSSKAVLPARASVAPVPPSAPSRPPGKPAPKSGKSPASSPDTPW